MESTCFNVDSHQGDSIMSIGDRVQTLNTLCPISGEIVEIFGNRVVIADDDAETDDDRLEFHITDLELV